MCVCVRACVTTLNTGISSKTFPRTVETGSAGQLPTSYERENERKWLAGYLNCKHCPGTRSVCPDNFNCDVNYIRLTGTYENKALQLTNTDHKIMRQSL